jgi:hypothetical protein
MASHARDGGYLLERDAAHIGRQARAALAYHLAEPPGTLEDAARDELVALWSDLADAQEHALDGQWSIGCEWITARIARLSRLVGPVDWQAVGMSTVLDGTFVAVSDAIGVPYAKPTDADLEHCRALIARSARG